MSGYVSCRALGGGRGVGRSDSREVELEEVEPKSTVGFGDPKAKDHKIEYYCRDL